MNINYYIAKRYTFSKREFNFITIISTISILGIAVGVGVLISVNAIFNGFRSIAEDQMTGFDPHLRVAVSNTNTISESEISSVLNSKNIENKVAKLQTMQVAVIANKGVSSKELYLMDTSYFKVSPVIAESFLIGKARLNISKSENTVSIGVGIANANNLFIGDTLRLITPSDVERAIRTYNINPGQEFVISGIFQSLLKDYDDNLIIGSLNSGISKKSNTEFLDIRLTNPDDLELAKTLLTRTFPDNYIQDWKDLNAKLYQIMKFESMATFLILGIIIAIAVFNILASLTMTVVEKKQDIALLKALGLKKKDVAKIFFFEGIINGGIGTFAGLILGLFFCWGQLSFKWFRISVENAIVDSIPIVVNSEEIIITCAFSICLSAIAALYPSLRAADLPIAQTIRG